MKFLTLVKMRRNNIQHIYMPNPTPPLDDKVCRKCLKSIDNNYTLYTSYPCQTFLNPYICNKHIRSKVFNGIARMCRKLFGSIGPTFK